MIVHNDFDLSSILWYKIGGVTRYLLECSTEEDILEALDFVDKKNIVNIFTCGLGSNLIFTDEYFDGAVIRIVRTKSGLISDDKNGSITSFAGEVLDAVVEYSLDRKLVGLEWAGGLPGTVGAGVRGNVGAFGGEIKDVIEQAYVAVFENGRVDTKILSNSDLNFSYRTSTIKLSKNMVVLSASFNLVPTDNTGVTIAREIFLANKKYRKDRHPLEYPNCGSVFKNIKKKEEVEKILQVLPDIKEKVEKDWHGKVSMGYLIHQLGFAGFSVGGAQVSEKHNNFIINTGSARASDVKKIIVEIQNATQEKFGFTPEVEVEIVE